MLKDMVKDDKLRFGGNGKLFIVDKVWPDYVSVRSPDGNTGGDISDGEGWEKITDEEFIILQKGFSSVEEFMRLVSSTDLSDPAKVSRFNEWKLKDGSKVGLLKILKGSDNEL